MVIAHFSETDTEARSDGLLGESSEDRRAEYDVVILTDLRFPGGSSASTLEEIRIQNSLSLRSGVYHRACSVLKRSRPFNRAIAESILTGECSLLNFEPRIKTKILLVRHPGVIHPPVSELPDILTDTVVLIVNHPPVNAQGRVDYLLPFARRILREKYGVNPMLCPIGPLVRDAINCFYDSTLKLEKSDWCNVFDLDKFATHRTSVQRPLRIGRHSRPGKEKWPDNAEDIRSAYLADSEHEVAILGGSEVPEEILGYRPKNWMIYPFGSVDVVEFLNSIDVFVYFHHPSWTEAFGRVIAEAMATGLPAILPHHFEPLFQKSAIYATPAEVARVLEELSDPVAYRIASERARQFVCNNFGRHVHVSRLRRLCPELLPEGRHQERTRM